MTVMGINDRPRPVRDAANEIKTWVGIASTLVASLGSAGVLLTADQVSATQGVLAVVPPVAAAVGTLLTAFGIVKRSEPLVTPMADPRDNDGTKLVAMG